jgi:hypothetical protein
MVKLTNKETGKRIVLNIFKEVEVKKEGET